MPGFNFPKYFSSVSDVNPQAEWEEQRRGKVKTDEGGNNLTSASGLPFHLRVAERDRNEGYSYSNDIGENGSSGISNSTSGSASLGGTVTNSSLAIETEVNELLLRASEQVTMEMHGLPPSNKSHDTKTPFKVEDYRGECTGGTTRRYTGYGSFRNIVIDGMDDKDESTTPRKEKLRKPEDKVEIKQSSLWEINIPMMEGNQVSGKANKSKVPKQNADPQMTSNGHTPPSTSKASSHDSFSAGMLSSSDGLLRSPSSSMSQVFDTRDPIVPLLSHDLHPDTPVQSPRSQLTSAETTPRFRPRPLLILDENNTLRPVQRKREVFNILQASDEECLPPVPEHLKNYFERFQNTPVDGLQHYANTGAYIHKLHKTERLVDAIVSVEEYRFGAHMVVLACYSDYFADLFDKVHGQRRIPLEIRLKGVNASAFQVFLDFAYTGRLDIVPNLVVDLIKMAENLQISSVKERCLSCVEYLPDRDIVLLLANFKNAPESDIFAHVMACVSSRFPEIVECDIFLHLDIDTVCILLCHEQLIVKSELDVFCAGVRWITFNQRERIRYLYRIMKCVRFTLMNQEELLRTFDITNIMNGDKACKQMIIEANWVITANIIGREDPLHLPRHKERSCEHCLSSHNCDKYYSAHEFLQPDTGNMSASSSEETTSKKNVNWHAAGVTQPPNNGHDILAVGDIHKLTSSTQLNQVNTVERYNLEKNRWNHMSVLPEPRLHHAITMLDGNLYLVGGKVPHKYSQKKDAPTRESFVFSPETNEWKSIAPMNTARMYHSLCTLNGMIYAIGGQDDRNSVLNSVECYDPATDNWFYVKSMSSARFGASAAELDGRLYIAGGCTFNSGHNNELQVLDSMECYDPNSNKWTAKKKLRLRRCHANMVSVDDQLYLCGGATWDYNTMSLKSIAEMDIYNAVGNSWCLKSSLKVPRHNSGCTFVDNKIYVIGGISSINRTVVLQSVECYDVIKEKWLTGLTDLPYQAQWITCVAVRKQD